MSGQRFKFLAIGVVVLMVFMWVILTQGPLAPVKVTVEKIQIGNLSNEVFGIGTVKARRSYNLAPTMTSRVKNVLVDQGKRSLRGRC